MKTPYDLIFKPQELVYANPVEKLPEWCRFPMSFAERCHYYHLREMEILSQYIHHPPFYIDMFEIKANRPMAVPFEVPRRQLFLYFMLGGTLSITSVNKRLVTQVNTNTFAMLYYGKGQYTAHTDKGHHTVLFANMTPEWLENISMDFPGLQFMLEKFRHSSRPYHLMHPCRIDRKVQRWLYKVYSYSKNNTGALDGNLRKYLSYILGHYNSVLGPQYHKLAYRVKIYLDDHYRSNLLNARFLALQFQVTERTLRNHFKREYGMTPYEYYSRLRITDAIRQMELHDLNIKDVYLSVGYGDESTFRYALKKFLK
ncbi:helix-turn-helix domain-containing protein [Sinomicrobium sp. M5D2P17]